MLSGVLEVIESFSSAIMSIDFNSAHILNKRPKTSQHCRPHPVLIEQNNFWDITEIVNNFPVF